jgi:hypothetical protein
VLHDVVAQRPGDAAALLRAERVFVSLPWRTLRARGADLTVQRVELDAPVLDCPPCSAGWPRARPERETRIPTLVDGLRIVRGRIDNDDWRIEGLSIDVPSLHPERLLRARVRGRYLDPPMSIPADLAIAIAHPRRLLAGAATGVAGIGTLTVANADWQVPAHVFLAGPLRLGKDSALMKPARLGIAARYRSAPPTLPFRLGLHGTDGVQQRDLALRAGAVFLDGDGAIPDASARGSVRSGKRLVSCTWTGASPHGRRPGRHCRAAVGIDLADAVRAGLQGQHRLRRYRRARTAPRRHPLRRALPPARGAGLAGRHGATGSPLPPLRGTLSTPNSKSRARRWKAWSWSSWTIPASRRRPIDGGHRNGIRRAPAGLVRPPWPP